MFEERSVFRTRSVERRPFTGSAIEEMEFVAPATILAALNKGVAHLDAAVTGENVRQYELIDERELRLGERLVVVDEIGISCTATQGVADAGTRLL